MPKKKIVILGGGFGGLYAYKGLYKHFKKDEIDVTIVSRTNYFLFTPLLHEVATGGVAHHQVVESIRQIIYKTNDTLHVGDVLSVDCVGKTVTTTLGTLSYDTLVVGLGATTNFFNAPGAKEHSLVLKDLNDAIHMRTRLIETFERASEISDPALRKEVLSFAVVGGGATGVELVGEIAELFKTTLLPYYHARISASDISLYLINRGPELLAPFHPSLRAHALSALTSSGVIVRNNTSVQEVTERGIVCGDGAFVRAETVIWTAGVSPRSSVFTTMIAVDPSGRVPVSSSLQLESYPDVYIVGDISLIKDASGSPLPMSAQVAVKQGLYVGRRIYHSCVGNECSPFAYKSRGELASLGRYNAVANIMGFCFSGFFAWFLWRTVYLSKFFSFSKKLKIALDWTLNLFYPRDITKA
jgi:NADH:ubiquinone reductase (H+-translocating)